MSPLFFFISQETLYLTVAILDRYLSAEGLKVKRQKLQLIGVTAMFVASKYEEMYNPEIGNFLGSFYFSLSHWFGFFKSLGSC